MSVIITLVAGLSTSVFAAAQESDSTLVLSGPRVSETNVTSSAARFTEPNDQIERVRAMGMNPRSLRQVLAAFETAPEDIRLSPEQRTKIEGTVREYMGMAMEQMRQRRMAEGQPQRVRPGQQPDRMADPMADPMMQDPKATPPADRPQRQNTRPQRPNAQPAQDQPAPARPAQGQLGRGDAAALRPLTPTQLGDLDRAIRGVLTPPQREFLDEQLSLISAQQFEQATMQMYREQAADQFAKAGAKGKPGEFDLSRLPERMRQRLEGMTPEQREQAIEMLRQRYAERMGQAPGRRGEAGKSGKKALPSVDEIEIPTP